MAGHIFKRHQKSRKIRELVKPLNLRQRRALHPMPLPQFQQRSRLN